MINSTGISTIIVEGNELQSLYVFLKSYEEQLDRPLLNLLRRMEKKLYENLSISEIEKLQKE